MSVVDPFFLHTKSWCRSTLQKIYFRCCICRKTFCTSNQIKIL